MMDIMVPESFALPRLAGLRGPERNYALIDYETATLDLTGVELERRRKEDVRRIAQALEDQLRVCMLCSLSSVGLLLIPSCSVYARKGSHQS